MNSLQGNSTEYYELLEKRGKYGRNTGRYNAFTELLRVNKMERKLILEEQALGKAQDKLVIRVDRFKRMKQNRQEIIELVKRDLKEYF